MLTELLDSILGAFARFSQRFAVWHRWTFIPALAIVIGHRVNLRRNNLIDTETGGMGDTPPADFDIMGWRTPDGRFNDLTHPKMGAAGARFGRNVPLAETFAPPPEDLMDPSPRLVSERLLKRKTFTPVPHLNLHAAAWIQFMVHDWLSHGGNDTRAEPFDVPLPVGDH